MKAAEHPEYTRSLDQLDGITGHGFRNCFMGCVVVGGIDEKKTALGTGYFLTWVLTYTDQTGEVLGRQRFRVLRFRPAR